jgi:xylono-1,5-lactonase
METVASGYTFLEAPRTDPSGNLYFSDVLGGGVYRRATDGTITTVVPKRRGVGGLLLHADGGVVVSGRDVVHVRDGVTRVLLTLDGVVGFNDMTADAAGRVFVGSLRSNAFHPGGPRVPGELWRIDPDGGKHQVYGEVDFANGVGFSPDGGIIYQSEHQRAEIIAHDLGDDGTGSRRRVFARMPRGNPDGLAVDEAGGVWAALGSAGALARFHPDGRLDALLEVPTSFVTSLCFGGPDRRDLYITTTDNTEAPERKATVFRTRVAISGLTTPLARV